MQWAALDRGRPRGDRRRPGDEAHRRGASLVVGERVDVVGPFSIHHVQNSGIAFGLFASATLDRDRPDRAGRDLDARPSSRARARATRCCRSRLGLVLGGSISNLVDRVRLGYVTDFLDVGPWPAFNLADSFIVVGVAPARRSTLDAPLDRPARVRVPDDAAGTRLDRFLAALPEVGSRAAAERLIEAGRVTVDGAAAPKSHRLGGGEEVEFEPEAERRRSSTRTSPLRIALRGRAPARRRQAGRASSSIPGAGRRERDARPRARRPGRRAGTTGPAGHRPPARPRHVRAARRRPLGRGARAPAGAGPRSARSSASTSRSCAAARARAAAGSRRRSAATAASRRGMSLDTRHAARGGHALRGRRAAAAATRCSASGSRRAGRTRSASTSRRSGCRSSGDRVYGVAGRPRPGAAVPPRGAARLPAPVHGRAGRGRVAAPGRPRGGAGRGEVAAKVQRFFDPTTRWELRCGGADRRAARFRRGPAGRNGNQPEKGVAPVAVVSMRELLEAGVHFGHQTRRWNPKMRRFIFSERGGIYIIDLSSRSSCSRRLTHFVRNIAERNGTVLFVGTKKQAQDAVEEQAKRVGMPYVNHRWLGGLLTNWKTISDRIERLHELRRLKEEGQLELLPAKERISMEAELEKLDANLGGVADMRRQPDARLRRRPAQGEPRRPRGAAARRPGDRARRHELRPGRRRPRHPGERRRDPGLHARGTRASRTGSRPASRAWRPRSSSSRSSSPNGGTARGRPRRRRSRGAEPRPSPQQRRPPSRSSGSAEPRPRGRGAGAGDRPAGSRGRRAAGARAGRPARDRGGGRTVSVPATLVKELRDQTGAGMMDCQARPRGDRRRPRGRRRSCCASAAWPQAGEARRPRDARGHRRLPRSSTARRHDGRGRLRDRAGVEERRVPGVRGEGARGRRGRRAGGRRRRWRTSGRSSSRGSARTSSSSTRRASRPATESRSPSTSIRRRTRSASSSG